MTAIDSDVRSKLAPEPLQFLKSWILLNQGEELVFSSGAFESISGNVDWMERVGVPLSDQCDAIRE
jgi:hypothetical protein